MPRFIDLTGQSFGRLVAIEYLGGRRYRCVCSCGGAAVVRADHLKEGRVCSCGCIQSERAIDLSPGKRFGRLVVISEIDAVPGNRRARCMCDCGNETTALAGNLDNKNTASCGCLGESFHIRHGVAAKNKRHEHKYLYECWSNIKQRCLNPRNPNYANYGGRGIGVDPSWANSFEAFYHDIMEHLGDRPQGHSLDRYPDNDGSYFITNLRWASRYDQATNKRPTGEWKRQPSIMGVP